MKKIPRSFSNYMNRTMKFPKRYSFYDQLVDSPDEANKEVLCPGYY